MATKLSAVPSLDPHYPHTHLPHTHLLLTIDDADTLNRLHQMILLRSTVIRHVLDAPAAAAGDDELREALHDLVVDIEAAARTSAAILCGVEWGWATEWRAS